MRHLSKTTLSCMLLSFIPLLVAVQAHAFPIRMGLAPDNNQSILLSELRSARNEIKINIYQLESPEITQAIISQIQSGLTVQVLVEGEPFGSLSASGKTALSQLSRAVKSKGAAANSRVWVMAKPQSSTQKRRYRWNHAKYVLIDQQRALIASENFSGNGHPQAGKVGNRGWDVVVEDSGIVSTLNSMFSDDTNLKYGDVREVSSSDLGGIPTSIAPANKSRNAPTIPEARGEARAARLITSPHSLDGLTSLIRSAQHNLEIEEMSLPANWRANQNPIVTELIRAAQRGVTVRVLLNDDNVWSQPQTTPDPPAGIDAFAAQPIQADAKGNELTRQTLEAAAQNENLPLQARIVNIRQTEITYIHNKGMTVDGHLALVSSINGTQNSVEQNREVAILLESSDAARYYGGAFDWDWLQSDASRAVAKVRAFFESPLQFTQPEL